jgi:hypothetical protein
MVESSGEGLISAGSRRDTGLGFCYGAVIDASWCNDAIIVRMVPSSLGTLRTA